MGLFEIQAKVYQTIIRRLSDAKPSILWAGMQAGKTVICCEVSQTMEAMPQLLIGNFRDTFIGFHATEDEYLHPSQLPIDALSAHEGLWERITPNTLVFIDDLFMIPDAERLYNRVCEITPHVVATGQLGDTSFPIGRYLKHWIGPYSSWEMNPLLDADIMRRERDKRHDSPEDRIKFNHDVVACVDKTNWKYWSAE